MWNQSLNKEEFSEMENVSHIFYFSVETGCFNPQMTTASSPSHSLAISAVPKLSLKLRWSYEVDRWTGVVKESLGLVGALELVFVE